MTAATYLNYSASAWLLDDSPASEAGERARTPLVSEMGYWRLSRPATDADAGPGLLPPLGAPVAAHRRRRRGCCATPRADSTSRSSLVHADGVSELYLGADQRTADRHRDRCGRAHRRREGLCGRDPHVRPRRRSPAVGVGHRRARARTRVARLRTPCAGRTDAGGLFARVPGAVVDETGLRHLGNPLGEQRALASGRGGRAPGRPRGARGPR